MRKTSIPLRRQYSAVMANFLKSPSAAWKISLGCLITAVLVGLSMPRMVPIELVEEGGLVETGTLMLYGAAVVGLALARLPLLPSVDRVCAAIMLIAFAAREADMHVSLFGFSILKARFYSTVGTPEQIAVALLILAPVAVALCVLIARNKWRWRTPLERWSSPVATVAVFVLVLGVAKALDKIPGLMQSAGAAALLSDTLRHVMLSVEEILEFLLPGLVLLAIGQSWSNGGSGKQERPSCCGP